MKRLFTLGALLVSAAIAHAQNSCNAYFSYQFDALSGTINFYDQSFSFDSSQTNAAASWNWTFGDGQTSTLQNPAVALNPNTGLISACLDVTFTNNCSASFCDTLFPDTSVVISPVGCSAYFYYQIDDSSNTITFYDQSSSYDSIGISNTATAWNWIFGNGQTSTLQNPSVPLDSSIYANAVCLEVTFTNNCTAYVCDSLFSNNNVDPCAYMFVSYNITNPSGPGTNDGAIDIQVNNGSDPYIYEWNTGATTEDIDNLAPGMYSVTVTDNNYCVTYASMFLFEQADSNTVITPIDSLYTTAVDTCFGYIIDDVYVYNVSYDSTQLYVTWAFQGQDSIGFVNVTYTFDGMDGIYTIFLANDCNGKRSNIVYSDLIYIIKKVTGIEEQKTLSKLNLYPNPAVNNVSVDFDVKENALITSKIINTLGQVVYSSANQYSSGNQSIRFDVSTLHPGMYFIQLSNEKGEAFTKNFVK